MKQVPDPNPPSDAPSFGFCCADIYELPITHFLLGESFHPGGVELTRSLAGKCLIGRESKVLDLACRRGATSLFLAREYACQVTAVDLGAQNLAALEQAVKEQHLGDRITTLLASIDSLPLPGGSFDAVICECALCTFERPDQVLQEIFRILKPRARFALSDIYLNEALPDHLTGPLSRMFCLAGARTIDEYECLLEGNGFQKLRITVVDWAITQMLDRIEKQLKLIEGIEDAEALFSDDLSWRENAQDILADIRKLCHSGGLGYVTIAARTPARTQ